MELYFENRERIISVDVEIKQNNINPVFQSLLWFPSQKGYQAILMSVLVIIFYKLFCLCSSMIHAAWTMRWNCINHAWIMHWGKFCFSIQSEKIIIVKRISPSKNSTKNEFWFGLWRILIWIVWTKNSYRCRVYRFRLKTGLWKRWTVRYNLTYSLTCSTQNVNKLNTHVFLGRLIVSLFHSFKLKLLTINLRHYHTPSSTAWPKKVITCISESCMSS